MTCNLISLIACKVENIFMLITQIIQNIVVQHVPHTVNNYMYSKTFNSGHCEIGTHYNNLSTKDTLQGPE